MSTDLESLEKLLTLPRRATHCQKHVLLPMYLRLWEASGQNMHSNNKTWDHHNTGSTKQWGLSHEEPIPPEKQINTSTDLATPPLCLPTRLSYWWPHTQIQWIFTTIQTGILWIISVDYLQQIDLIYSLKFIKKQLIFEYFVWRCDHHFQSNLYLL